MEEESPRLSGSAFVKVAAISIIQSQNPWPAKDKMSESRRSRCRFPPGPACGFVCVLTPVICVGLTHQLLNPITLSCGLACWTREACSLTLTELHILYLSDPDNFVTSLVKYSLQLLPSDFMLLSALTKNYYSDTFWYSVLSSFKNTHAMFMSKKKWTPSTPFTSLEAGWSPKVLCWEPQGSFIQSALCDEDCISVSGGVCCPECHPPTSPGRLFLQKYSLSCSCVDVI